MNNEERKNYYLSTAGKEYQAMQMAWEDEDWNRVIRKAQETIELLLKGILKYMNIEFPKEHDIGEYFEDILIKKGIHYSGQDLEKIKDLSKSLTDKRAPAYYGEEFYSKEEAERAKAGAEFVKIFTADFLKKLKG